MLLQTLFASCLFCSAISASMPPSTMFHPALIRHSVTIQGGRSFSAEIISPSVMSRDSRYPGVIIIATDETRDRGFLIASRMAEIGITAMMFVQDDNEPHSYQVHDASAAIDSMRSRYDVRPEEVGVIAFEQATHVVPALVRDTTLDFAIAANSADPVREMVSRYSKAHAATLLVHGVRNRSDSAAVVLSLGLNGSSLLSVVPNVSNPTDPSIKPTLTGTGMVSPNVTIWPVQQDELKAIGEAHSPLCLRLVSWVRDQVHASANPEEQAGIPVH